MQYYGTYVGTMEFFAVNILSFGTKYEANLEILSCQVLFYQPLHTSRSEEYLESTVQKHKKLRISRLSHLAPIRVHAEVRNG